MEKINYSSWGQRELIAELEKRDNSILQMTEIEKKVISLFVASGMKSMMENILVKSLSNIEGLKVDILKTTGMDLEKFVDLHINFANGINELYRLGNRKMPTWVEHKAKIAKGGIKSPFFQ